MLLDISFTDSRIFRITHIVCTSSSPIIITYDSSREDTQKGMICKTFFSNVAHVKGDHDHQCLVTARIDLNMIEEMLQTASMQLGQKMKTS